MAGWRLLPFETCNAFTNMAVDEAVLIDRVKNLAPNTLRLYKWKPSAVSIGRFQSVQEEIRVDECKKNEIDIVRRITGGGTVYHDTDNEVTYSVVVAKKDLETDSITRTYEKIYDCIASGLKTLGVAADFREGTERACPNLTVCGKKVSGSAQSHKGGVVLQHGTILIDVDLEKMFTFLRVGEKSCIDSAAIAKNKITSISIELGQSVSVDHVREAITEGFIHELEIEIAQGPLSIHERSVAEILYEQKYSTNKWNLLGETDQG